MKKAIALLASLALAASLAACGGTQQAGESGVSGTFTGDAIGQGGEEQPVTVSLTFEDNVIKNVEIEGPGETEGIGSKAIEAFPDLMVANNTINVDAISGATITSNAILEAAAEALESAGLNPADYAAAAAAAAGEVETADSYDVDIVVVGAGGAGMTAAITAADAGANVMIVESQPMVGGNTVRSTGGLNAAPTEYQNENEFGEEAGVEATLATAAEKWADNETITALAATVQEQWDAYQASPEGYFDSTELMALDTMIGGKGINDPALVTALTENSADAIAWLEENGAELKSVGAFGGASVKRIHRPVNDEGKTTAVGAYLVPILEKNVNDRGIEVLLETTATKILLDDAGAAAGIEAQKGDQTITINAKAVIIATGGFGGNMEMVGQYREDLKDFVSTNAAGALGQGITMGEEVGVATVDIDQIQIHPTVHVDPDGNAHLITEGLRGDGAILVNKEGERFTDEVGTRDAVSAAEIAQTDGEVWLIIDQKMVDASAVIQGYLNAGYAYQGDTWEALAGEIGAPAETLTATMERWAEIHAAKDDADFGRTSFNADVALDTAPFYAISVSPGIHHTMGGLQIDDKTQVVTTDGGTIAGLFAAGEVTGGVHGANRLGGNAVADITVFGRIAGENAAAYVK